MGVCVAKKNIRPQRLILGRRGREAIAPFPADRHPGWGGGGEGRLAAQRKEEVNKRVLKELLPIHCTKKRKKIFRSFLDFHFLPSYCKVEAQNAPKRSC